MAQAMNTNPSGTSFAVCFQQDLYLLRVVGPGICRESGRFENLLLDVEARKPARVVIDLSECPRMDSTFAGAFLRLADRAVAGHFQVYVAGARNQVPELLDTLCVTDVVQSIPLPDAEALQALKVEDRDLSKEQVMALSLDGHERLAALNEANAKKFGPLLAVLRDQLPAAAAGSSAFPGCP
jgi:anti-anti-sigma regulatory factor